MAKAQKIPASLPLQNGSGDNPAVPTSNFPAFAPQPDPLVSVGGFSDETSRVFSYLGGDEVFQKPVHNRLDAHEMIVEGMPPQALHHLVESLEVLDLETSLEKGVGVSLRTFQRSKSGAATLLSSDISGRTWKFAEILSRATSVFGSQNEAEHWLASPAIGLDQHRPIDLLSTPTGTELVETFLGQLQYGVYV